MMLLRVTVILAVATSVASGRMLESDTSTLSWQEHAALDNLGPLIRISRWYSNAGEVVVTERAVSWSDVFPFWLGAKPGTAGESTDGALTSEALFSKETNLTKIANETETNSESNVEETTNADLYDTLQYEDESEVYRRMEDYRVSDQMEDYRVSDQMEDYAGRYESAFEDGFSA